MNGLPTVTPDNEGMKAIAGILKDILPQNFGFALVVFEYHKPGLGNYISSAKREDMITALKELVDRLESKRDFRTPNNN